MPSARARGLPAGVAACGPGRSAGSTTGLLAVLCDRGARADVSWRAGHTVDQAGAAGIAGWAGSPARPPRQQKRRVGRAALPETGGGRRVAGGSAARPGRLGSRNAESAGPRYRERGRDRGSAGWRGSAGGGGRAEQGGDLVAGEGRGAVAVAAGHVLVGGERV